MKEILYVCDRCGGAVNRGEGRTLPQMRHLLGSPDSGSRALDLCGACVSDFLLWSNPFDAERNPEGMHR